MNVMQFMLRTHTCQLCQETRVENWVYWRRNSNNSSDILASIIGWQLGQLFGWRPLIWLWWYEKGTKYFVMYFQLNKGRTISQISPTRCIILFNIFIHSSSLHVSGIHVPIIRRKLMYPCDTGTCNSVRVAFGLLVGLNLTSRPDATHK